MIGDEFENEISDFDASRGSAEMCINCGQWFYPSQFNDSGFCCDGCASDYHQAVEDRHDGSIYEK